MKKIECEKPDMSRGIPVYNDDGTIHYYAAVDGSERAVPLPDEDGIPRTWRIPEPTKALALTSLAQQSIRSGFVKLLKAFGIV